MPPREVMKLWDDMESEADRHGEYLQAVRALCLNDLYYLLVKVCGRKDMLPCRNREGFVDNQFMFNRCREVETNPDGYLDLWGREHGKSSIITFGLTIQDILKDPEVTFGLFSHTRPIAKAFLRQIMRELESNKILHAAFPDILWGEDVRQAPKWALDVDTPILTTEGWMRHGDLNIGDKIFGTKGQVINVTGNSGYIYDSDCYKIVFDDCEIVASSEHLWPVQCKHTHTWDDSEIRIFQTHELTIGKKTRRMLPTPKIESKIIDCIVATNEVDPYILGLWLGDGTAGTNIISMHIDDEKEVLEQAQLAGFETYIHRKKENDNFSMYGLRGLKEKIEKAGCLKKKYIPNSYLYGNAKDRLSLLQGLMDSDGTCKKHSKHRAGGMCMFSNTNKELAEGVFFLASSLGMRPSTINFMPKQAGHQRIYHVYFVGIKSNPPFRSERKLANCKDKRVKVGRYIRAIESIPSVTVNCIKVDAPDSLYLAGYSMVPTHNSEDDGIIVKRKTNPNMATIEAWGLVDGQPTSKHFQKLLYDDIVVQGSVSNPEMIQKTMTALEQSYNLGVTPGGVRRFVGTRWHFNDAYRTITDRQTVELRHYPGKDDGTEDGKSVYWDEETHLQKRRDMGPYTYAAQILLNPKADAMQGFKREWLRFYTKLSTDKMNKYILVDAANSKKKGSDYTSMWVVGLATDGNYYALDMIRDRLNLTERADRLFLLHRKWRPKQVRYERYGLMADIEHIKARQENETYRFDITEVAGQTSKTDRVKRLLPIFENGRFYLPKSMYVTDWQKIPVDLVHAFVEEEFMAFPVGLHDDMLDALARIAEPDFPLVWPMEAKKEKDTMVYHDIPSNVAWMM